MSGLCNSYKLKTSAFSFCSFRISVWYILFKNFKLSTEIIKKFKCPKEQQFQCYCCNKISNSNQVFSLQFTRKLELHLTVKKVFILSTNLIKLSSKVSITSMSTYVSQKWRILKYLKMEKKPYDFAFILPSF